MHPRALLYGILAATVVALAVPGRAVGQDAQSDNANGGASVDCVTTGATGRGAAAGSVGSCRAGGSGGGNGSAARPGDGSGGGSGVAGATTSGGLAGAVASSAEGSLPFTGLPLWTLVAFAAVIVLAGTLLRRHDPSG